MKKKQLVYVLMYGDNILAICANKARARAIAKMHVVDLDYLIDKFTFIELPLER